MNKEEFLKQLRGKLKNVSKEEKEDILYDYEEHFKVGLEQGRTEKEIIEALGNPSDIAKQYVVNLSIQNAQENVSTNSIVKAVLASLSLGFFNIVIVLGPFLALVGTFVGLFSGAIAMTVGGIAGFFASIIGLVIPRLGSMGFAGIFLSIGTTALGILWLIGNSYIAKYFYKITLKYLKWNYKTITGKEL